MSRIVKGIGSGIGLAREAYVARSRSHSPNPSIGPESQAQHGEAHFAEDEDSESDEEDWILDDAQNEPPPSYDASQSAQGIDGIIQDFGRQHPEQSTARIQAQLPFPVIVPQRRPEKKERGFVKAYAPALHDCGIDQKTFLDFLFAFEKAIKVRMYQSNCGLVCQL